MNKLFLSCILMCIICITSVAFSKDISISGDNSQSSIELDLENETVSAIENRVVCIKYNNMIQRFYDANHRIVFPITYEGTTYLPIRAIASLLCINIDWDGETNSIFLEDSGDKGIFSSSESSNVYLGKASIDVIINKKIKTYYNGELQTFKDANGVIVYPISYNDTTYLPVRALSNLFGLFVDYDYKKDTVLLIKEIEEFNIDELNNQHIKIADISVLSWSVEGSNNKITAYSFYTDGIVEKKFDDYKNDAIKTSFSISSKKLKEINSIMKNNILSIKEQELSISGGKAWSFKYYDVKGNIQGEYSGHYYLTEGEQPIDELIKIVEGL